MRTTAAGATAAFALMCVLAPPAAAKVPPFTLEVSTAQPEPRGAVTVTVVVDDVDLVSSVEGHELTGLLGLFPIEEVGADLRPLRPWQGEVEIALVHDRDGVYRGEIVAPDVPGEYVLVPFPAVVNFPSDAETLGYPDPLVLTVTATSSWPLRAAVPWGIAGLVVLLAATLLSRRDVARPM
jgi:hypothetical protein